MIDLEITNEIAVIQLSRGVTNAINYAFVEKFSKILQKLHESTEVKSIVISSKTEKFFSIGFDLPELIEYSQSQFADFFHSFNLFCMQLYTFPKPVIAALKGHATAGGCILATCCDYRIIADGKKYMGLNEIKLGVPLPYPCYLILKDLVGATYIREICEFGDFYLPDRLKIMGLVDSVQPANEVFPISMEKAKILGSYSPSAFSLIKRDRVEVVEELVKWNLESKEKEFVNLWYSKEVRNKLFEAAKKY